MLENWTRLCEERLLHRETSFVGSSVTRCASKFHLVTRAKLADAEDIDVALDAFVKEVELFKLDILKVQSSHDACDQQLLAYDEVERTTQQDVANMEEDVRSLEQSFMREKLIRSHREKLEIVSRVVNTLQSRSSLKRKMNRIESELKLVDSSIESMNKRILKRKQQFEDLLSTITQMQNGLSDDNEASESSTVADQGGDNDMNEDDEEDLRDKNNDNDKDTKVSEGANAGVLDHEEKEEYLETEAVESSTDDQVLLE